MKCFNQPRPTASRDPAAAAAIAFPRRTPRARASCAAMLQAYRHQVEGCELRDLDSGAYLPATLYKNVVAT